MKKKISVRDIILNAAIVVLLFVMLYPLIMSVWCSLKTVDIYNKTKFYPTFPLQINNYVTAFKSCYRFIINTVYVGVAASAISLILSSLTAFAFTKLEMVGKNFLFSAMLALMMIPGVLTLVPSYMLYCALGLYNTYIALILPTAINGSVFGVFLLAVFIKGIPESFFEAARLDGANLMQIFMSIVIPLSAPIIGTLAIMKIVGVWNDYLWPQIMIQDIEKQLVSSGISFTFTSMYSSNMPITFAGYLLASMPIILLFSLTTKTYISGLMNSGLKL